ncbi:MAG: peptidoglycan-binding domain-containing protein [Proteobacteria bacterium]|nr:peptidoglycan-binding domain-containing protein [Pseudomonadota bacterium]
MGVSNRSDSRNDEDLEYEPDAMGRLGQGRWVPRRTRDPFGRLSTDIPSPMSGEDRAPGPFDLLAPVGPDQWNLGGDVDRVEGMLIRTGHLSSDPIVTGRGEFMARQEQAIKGFQRDHGLRQDGLINPKAPTHRGLLASLEAMNDTGVVASGEVGDKPDARGGAASKETQVAVAPLALPLVPVAIEGATVLYALLTGAATAAILSVSGDTPRKEGPKDGATGHADDRRIAYRGLVTATTLKPIFERKGGPETRRGNDIVIQECDRVLKEEHPEFADRITHIGGGTEKGEGEIQVKELHIPNKANPGNTLKDGSFTDLAYGSADKGTPRGHLNTISVLADGITPTKREQYQLDKLARKLEPIVHTLPKYQSAKWTEEEYRELAKNACRALMDELVREIERDEKNKSGSEGDGE